MKYKVYIFFVFLIAQYDFELTSIPDTPLSPVHNFNLSKVHLFDSELGKNFIAYFFIIEKLFK